MKRFLLPVLAAAMVAATVAGSSRAQSFPFEDAFTAYEPGSTGAPAWSLLGGAFNTGGGVLRGRVTVRFNARPPQQFVADLTLTMSGPGPVEAILSLNHQHNADTAASDVVVLNARPAAPTSPTAASTDTWQVLAGVDRSGEPVRERETISLPPADGPVSLRVVVDTEAGRYAVFLDGKPLLTSVPMEYPAGLLSVSLSEGAGLDRIVLRAPTADEKRALLLTTLFNDPRDIADAGGGNLLVLHRGSPAVLTVTPDGEVTRSFGRRAPGGIPDPVAIERGPQGEVMVLNRFPGEVVVYERNGGIRHRFGHGRLREPADLAVLPDGTTYIADPAAKALAVFASGGRFLGNVTSFGAADPTGATGSPVRLGRDTFGNLVVVFADPARVAVLRPGADRLSMALVSESTAPLSDIVATEGRMLAYLGGAVAQWPTSEGAPAFRAALVGGLEPDGRLAVVGPTVYALDRWKSRIVAVPPTFMETPPSISFLNLAQSAGLVRWTSALPVRDARVRLWVGDRWHTERQVNEKPTEVQQVPVTRLKPGQTYRYQVSPTVATIPPTDWSVEYTFETAPTAGGGAAPDRTRDASAIRVDANAPPVPPTPIPTEKERGK